MSENNQQTKYCKWCGNTIHVNAVVCPHCGRQVEELESQKKDQPIIINNNNNVSSSTSSSSSAAASAAVNNGGAYYHGKRVKKSVALLLCIFLGAFGAHKFYEGKIGMGILYLFTGGLLCIGWIVDIFKILGKPSPYYYVY